MSQISNSEDVYRELVDDAEVNWLLGLTAFGVFEERRIDWMRHVATTKGGPPTPEEIEDWYKQQPPNELLKARAEAENALRTYADVVLENVVDEERRETAEGVIVGEIRLGRRFAPQFWVNFVGGLASAFVFAAILVVVALIVLRDTSVIELVK